MMKLTTAILTAITLAGCTPYSNLPPVVNHNGPIPTGTPADCAAACTTLRAHHCAAGDPTPKGASCEDVCQNTESSGYASMNPRCVATSADCAAADACSDAADPSDAASQ